MNVPAAVGLAELSKITAHKPNRMVAHPTGEPLGSISHAAPLVVAIGPEGGFTDLEVAGLESVGWRSVSLGPRILRIETAAIAVAAVVVA
jgi:16S rRNA (uracil1498-N3)-methyltransferase